MEQLTALGSHAEGIERLPTRRRRPSRSPIAPSLLAERLWRAARPFVPLALLAIVFALSLGVVQIVERATPVSSAAPSVSSAGS